MGRNPRNPSCGEDHPVQLQIITSLGMAGLAQDGQGKALCATASSAQMHLAFTGFFPSTEQVNFGKAGAALLGVVFPLGVYMSVHPISSSPDLHLAGREAGRAKGCEHWAVPFPGPEFIPALLAAGLQEDTCSWDGDSGLGGTSHIPGKTLHHLQSPSLPKSQSPCGTQGMSHCPVGDLCSLPSQTLHLPASALCPFTIQPQQGGRGLLLDPSHRQGAANTICLKTGQVWLCRMWGQSQC